MLPLVEGVGALGRAAYGRRVVIEAVTVERHMEVAHEGHNHKQQKLCRPPACMHRDHVWTAEWDASRYGCPTVPERRRHANCSLNQHAAAPGDAGLPVKCKERVRRAANTLAP